MTSSATFYICKKFHYSTISLNLLNIPGLNNIFYDVWYSSKNPKMIVGKRSSSNSKYMDLNNPDKQSMPLEKLMTEHFLWNIYISKGRWNWERMFEETRI